MQWSAVQNSRRPSAALFHFNPQHSIGRIFGSRQKHLDSLQVFLQDFDLAEYIGHQTLLDHTRIVASLECVDHFAVADELFRQLEVNLAEIKFLKRAGDF